MAVTAAPAPPTAGSAAGAPDATSLEPPVCFIFNITITLMFILGSLMSKQRWQALAAAAAAGARDATRLESLVCFYFILFITLMFF